MKIFFLRLFFILAIVFFELSFLGVLFPQSFVPLVLIASVVIWVLVVGFSSALFMIIPLSVFFDIVSSGMPGAFTLYAVMLAYATSFLLRRLLVEHLGIGTILYALFAGAGAIGYILFDFIFFQVGLSSEITNKLTNLQAVLSFSKILLITVLILPIFTLMYQIIRYFEKYTSSLSQRDFLKVK